MADNKRTEIQKIKDLRDISAWYLRGYTQAEIMEFINTDPERNYQISRRQVGYDIAKVREQWLADARMNFDERVSRELAKIDKLEATYAAAWERSCEDAIKIMQRQTEKGDGKTMQRSVEEQVGDPRFLQGIERCIQMRCKLLGVNAPDKIAPTDPTGQRQYDGKVIEVIEH